MTSGGTCSLAEAVERALARRTCEFELVQEPEDLSARYSHGGGSADLQARRMVMRTRLFDAQREAELREQNEGPARLREWLLKHGTEESRRVIEGTVNWIEREPGDWFAVDSAAAGLPRAFGDPFWILDVLAGAVVDDVQGERVLAHVNLLTSEVGPFEVVPRGRLRRTLARNEMRWAAHVPLKVELRDGELLAVAYQGAESGPHGSGWIGPRVLRWGVPFEWPPPGLAT
jgi:hypothetical protein